MKCFSASNVEYVEVGIIFKPYNCHGLVMAGKLFILVNVEVVMLLVVMVLVVMLLVVVLLFLM